MATRRSSRKRKVPANFQDTSKKPRNQPTGAITLEKSQMQELVKMVTESVLETLHSKQVVDNSDKEKKDETNSRAVDAVQGSVSAVLDNISGES